MTPGVTFAVDDVAHARHPLRECDLAEALDARLKEPVLGTSHRQARFVQPLDTHPLMAAVHLAFSEHRPLVLSPDIIWLTIAQGLALHVTRNAEALRSDLVRHQGRKRLEVERERWDLASAEFWSGVVGDFSARLHEESTALHELMVCDFSTTGSVERVVSQVVLMDALREYFDYSVKSICGIPTVTLEGTPADWSRLREKVEQLSRYGLDWWVQHLLPLCDQFVRAAQGSADRRFWQSIYKLREAYGADVINGWSCKLFPFIRNGSTGHYDLRNPVFESDPDAEKTDRHAPPLGWIRSEVLPTGLSRVPLVLALPGQDGTRTKRKEVALTAGFLGVSQSPETLALRPVLGWVAHVERGLEPTLRRLLEEHQAAPPLPEDQLSAWVRAWARDRLPAELHQLYSTCDGASLFGGQGKPMYRIRSALELEFLDAASDTPTARHGPPRGTRFIWTRFCDLEDGSFLAFRLDRGGGQGLPIFWVKAAARERVCVAKSLEQFLLRALDSEGRPYFQEPGFNLKHWRAGHQAPRPPQDHQHLVTEWGVDGQGAPVVLRGHEGWLMSAAFSPDGQQVVTASADKTARVWRVDGQEEPVVLRGHREWLRSAALSPDGQRVVTASFDGTARVWRVDGQEEPVVLDHQARVWSAAFSPDGQRVVTASDDKTARVWRVDGKGAPVVLRGHRDSVFCAAFSPDGQWVVTASEDGTARVWRVDGQEAPVVLHGHEGGVVRADFSPDGQRVVTASFDETARVWRVDGQEEPAVLDHQARVWSAAFSPDGQRVVTASDDKTARVWRVDEQEGPLVLRGHEGGVVRAAFSPDGQRVVTASDDKTARVWRMDGQREVVVLRGHEAEVSVTAFSPDGQRMVTASKDGTARLWVLSM
jgi:WD40 repeat protein